MKGHWTLQSPGARERWIATLACVVATLALAGAAPAAADYQPSGSFGGPGSGDGEFSTPGRAAAEQATGNLFVVDSANNRVQLFAPKGDGTAEYLTQFGAGELSAPWGIAIDEDAGQTFVYVADAGNDRIVKYASDEAATPSFSVDATFVSPAKGSGAGEVGDFHAALAIDPTTHELLVADPGNKLVERFEADGTFASAFDGSDGGSAFEGPIDVAVNSTGDVYVVDANGDIANGVGTSRVLRYSGTGEYKATLGPVGTHERPATVAVNPASDEVVVSGDQDAVYEAGPPPFVPALQLFDASNQPLPTPKINTSATFDTVSGVAFASEVEGTRLYVVLDVGRYFGSPYGTPQVQAFVQPNPTAPIVVDQSASPLFHEATLKAQINPGNAATQYHFEYGTSSAYGESTAEKTIPAGGTAVSVKADLFGLAAGTVYHYRVVASNSIGDASGADQTFTTKLEDAPAANCSNEQVRLDQNAIALPDCRAYEMVTPVDKNGQDVGLPSNEFSNTAPAAVAADGQRLSYLSSNAFPGANEGTRNLWFAHRDSSGWSSSPGNNPPGPSSDTGYLVPQRPLGSSENQLAAGLEDSTTKTKPFFERNSLWVVRADGSRDQIVGSAIGPAANFRAISADAHHVVFTSTEHLVSIPGEPDTEGRELLYEWTDQSGAPEIRLVNVDDGGQLLGNGEANLGGAIAGAATPAAYRDAISTDGSRIYFQSAPPSGGDGSGGGPLYLREEGTNTVEISAPESGHSPAAQVRYLEATPDGARVFFWADGQLTDAAPSAGGVYRYDVGDESLTWLTEAASPQISAMASEDGNRLYIAPAPDQFSRVASGEIRVNEGGEDRVVITSARIEATDGAFSDSSDQIQPGANISSDGRFFSFLSCVDAPDCNTLGLYRFDAQNGQLLLAASVPHIGPSLVIGEVGRLGDRGRAMADDGTLFFTTQGALVPADANNRRDVYLWRPGETRLISQGTANFDSTLSGVSKSGDDVFFSTVDRLVRSDGDTNYDLYDARVSGGFAEAGPSPACTGEACQGPASSAPAFSAPSRIAGPGNPKAHRKKHRARKRHCQKPGRHSAHAAAKKRCGGIDHKGRTNAHKTGGAR